MHVDLKTPLYLSEKRFEKKKPHIQKKRHVRSMKHQ